MKNLVKDFIPPVLLKVAKKSRSLRTTLHSSYADALKECSEIGYQDSELVEMVVEKNKRFKKQLEVKAALDLGALKTMIGLGALAGRESGRPLRVLDFGGGGGYHYFIASSFLGKDSPLDWTVIETKAMADLAQKQFGATELKFKSLLSDLGSNFDLVFASSSIQYVENPEASLRELINLGAKHFFLTRTPFHVGSENIITVQASKLSDNGPGPMPEGKFSDRTVNYPVTFLSQKTVEKIIQEKYKIRFVVEEGDGGFSAGNHQLVMPGYFCDLLDD